MLGPSAVTGTPPPVSYSCSWSPGPSYYSRGENTRIALGETYHVGGRLRESGWSFRGDDRGRFMKAGVELASDSCPSLDWKRHKEGTFLNWVREARAGAASRGPPGSRVVLPRVQAHASAVGDIPCFRSWGDGQDPRGDASALTYPLASVFSAERFEDSCGPGSACDPLNPTFRPQLPGAKLHPESGLTCLVLCSLLFLI